MNKTNKTRLKSLLACAIAAVGLVGCSTVERTSPGIMEKFDVAGSDVPATETVLIRNSGWTLLYFIPALFGDVTWEPKANNGKGDINGGLWLFRDKCNVSDCYETLQKMADQQDCELSNVTLVDNSLISFGFTSYVEFLNCFIESNDVMVSGVLRSRNTAKTKTK